MPIGTQKASAITERTRPQKVPCVCSLSFSMYAPSLTCSLTGFFELVGNLFAEVRLLDGFEVTASVGFHGDDTAAPGLARASSFRLHGVRRPGEPSRRWDCSSPAPWR